MDGVDGVVRGGSSDENGWAVMRPISAYRVYPGRRGKGCYSNWGFPSGCDLVRQSLCPLY